MSKKSFNDIEQYMKNALEANEPAFKEDSWKKMEALLDKDEDRKRPFVFWLWLLIPLLLGTGGLGYYAYNRQKDRPDKLASETKNNQVAGNNNTGTGEYLYDPAKSMPGRYVETKPGNTVVASNVSLPANHNRSSNAVGPSSKVKGNPVNDDRVKAKPKSQEKELAAKNKISGKLNGKMNASLTQGLAVTDDDVVATSELPPAKPVTDPVASKEEDIVVVKIETDSKNGKEVEKMIDSVIENTVKDKKEKTRSSRFYIIVAGGAEASGTKLFSVDKITARAGLAAGYNINRNLSAQAGFFVSNKKYKADGSSYKAKPGSYWAMVAINEIDANCRVYEIPLQVNYNFTPGKKLSIFASVGLSSYIMKKENYAFSYTRYGAPYKAKVKYSGNKNLFSVLRISGGVDKKLGKQLSVFATPGISIPLAGIGEGEVKLYSTEILVGLKFTPLRKHK